MIKIPSGWEYILIDLEIDEKIVDSRIASRGTFYLFYKILLKEGQTQRLPWAIFIKKAKYKKGIPQINNTWQPRDRKGKFIKIENI